jgi:hypothetical protein
MLKNQFSTAANRRGFHTPDFWVLAAVFALLIGILVPAAVKASASAGFLKIQAAFNDSKSEKHTTGSLLVTTNGIIYDSKNNFSKRYDIKNRACHGYTKENEDGFGQIHLTDKEWKALLTKAKESLEDDIQSKSNKPAWLPEQLAMVNGFLNDLNTRSLNIPAPQAP